MRAMIGVGALFLCAACGGTELHVESNTTWSGHINGSSGASYDGSGNEVFKLETGVLTCWSFQKQTPAGSLRVYAVEGGIFGTGKAGDATTTAQYGVVSGCTSD